MYKQGDTVEVVSWGRIVTRTVSLVTRNGVVFFTNGTFMLPEGIPIEESK